jgi:hypothetical protein
MKKYCLLAVFLILTLVSFGQRTTIELPAFDKIEIFGPFKVKLIKAETAYAEFDFNGIDRDDIVCEVRRKSLELKFKNRHYINDWKEGRNSRYVEVNVYYNDIDVIEASAGAIVKSAEQLKSKFLIIDCSMGAEIRLDVYAKKIDAVSTMGAQLEMKGQTEFLDVKATTGGVLEARDLESKVTFVKANMGADVFVNATEEIEASAGFGANVRYSGKPSVRQTSRNFGGEVNRRIIDSQIPKFNVVGF